MGEKKVYSVAIDGPAGAGKSTLAKQVAQNLGFVYVDTGAIYRAVGYHMDLMGIGPKDKDGIERLLDDVNLKLTYDAGGLQHDHLCRSLQRQSDRCHCPSSVHGDVACIPVF